MSITHKDIINELKKIGKVNLMMGKYWNYLNPNKLNINTHDCNHSTRRLSLLSVGFFTKYVGSPHVFIPDKLHHLMISDHHLLIPFFNFLNYRIVYCIINNNIYEMTMTQCLPLMNFVREIKNSEQDNLISWAERNFQNEPDHVSGVFSILNYKKIQKPTINKIAKLYYSRIYHDRRSLDKEKEELIYQEIFDTINHAKIQVLTNILPS